MNKYELTKIKATANGEEVQNAILVHLTEDAFGDGDCVLFGYEIDELASDDDITDAIINNTPSTFWNTDDKGIYHCE